jgi:hypothetical protein
MKKNLHRLLLIFLLTNAKLMAQTAGFNYEAVIKPVDSSGFYNIALTPTLNVYSPTDYSDLRIVNDSGKWVPHLVWYPNDHLTEDAVVYDMKIIKNETATGNNDVVIQNTISDIRNITCTIKNAAAERYCKLVGSDDLQSWFVINDSIKIVYDSKGETVTTHFTLHFPPVNYKYFRIAINGRGKEPFKILQASTSLSTTLPGKSFRFPSLENPVKNIVQKDSGNFSSIKVIHESSYHFQQVELRVSGVKYFNRKAKLYIPVSGNHSFDNPGELLSEFIISNNSTLHFRVPLTQSTIFYIIIQNDDNLPLKIDTVKTFVDYRVATVYLEKRQRYKLLMDNPVALKPNYDIRLINIPSREKIPVAVVGGVSLLRQPVKTSPPKESSQKLIWLAITIAAIVLGFFTYRLITDMNKSKS